MGLSRTFLGFRPAGLANQAAAALREAIRRRTWIELLPSEHELAGRLGIGRSTVRGALAQLTGEGIITTRNGRRARILRHRQRSARPAPSVCLIVPYARATRFVLDSPAMSEIHAQLVEKQIGWEEIFDGRLNGKNPEGQLRRLVEDRPGVCWLLLRSTPAVQRWFMQARLPTLVLGSCHPGVKLPSVDMDYRALGWHAAGCMIQKGHRRLACVLPVPTCGGDIACYNGFVDYVAQSGSPTSVVKITAGASHSAFLSNLRCLLPRSSRPSAVLSILQENTLTLLFYLMKSKLDVPGDISVVASGEADIIFGSAIPELTRYRVSPEKVSNAMLRITQRLLAGLPLPLKPYLVVPSFVDGSTLSRPSGNGS